MRKFIETENLSYSYDEGEGSLPSVLKNINLKIERGEYVAILGHNGSGKSTLAKLLNLILLSDQGKIYIDGVDVCRSNLTDDEIFDIRKKIGMVFQNPDNQLVATVVEEDVAFGPENLGIEPKEIKERVYNALADVGMIEYARHAPHRLSGGQKQRVAIAGVIAMQPECIIFDESTAMLDPKGREDVIAIMEKLNRERAITVINITHHMDEAVRAGRVIVINEGEICMDAKPKEVFSNMNTLRQFGLEAPQSTELLYELNCNGEDFILPCLDENECVKIILEKYNNRR